MELKFELVNIGLINKDKTENKKKTEIFTKDLSELNYIISELQLLNIIPGEGDILETLNGNCYLIIKRAYTVEKIVFVIDFNYE